MSFVLTVPNEISSQCLIKVSDSTDGAPYDTNDAVFSIVPYVAPTITVISPNGREVWHIGSTCDITWTQTGLTGLVTIALDGENGFSEILGTAQATAGTFSCGVTFDACMSR